MSSEAVCVADVQGLPDSRGIAIQRVGVSRVRYPLLWHEADATTYSAEGEFRLSAFLAAEKRGTHMSRFMEQLHAVHDQLSLAVAAGMPEILAGVLGTDRAEFGVRFAIFRQVSAPVTGRSGMQPVDVQVDCRLVNGRVTTELSIALQIATVCPCSREISARGAHNQRGIVTVRGSVRSGLLSRIVLADLAAAWENCASVPLYPVLKRSDEKRVTEQGYDTAKFVEDVARDVVLQTRQLAIFSQFTVEVENQESIHTHNAFAIIEQEEAKDE